MRFFDFWKSRKKRRGFEENEVWKKSKTRLNAACLRCQKQVEKAEKSMSGPGQSRTKKGQGTLGLE